MRSLDSKTQVILVVDDDQILLRGLERILRHAGYSPITASGPLQALKNAREFPGEIHLLLTDIVMPDMDGFALAQRIARERSDVRVLLMTAYARGTFLIPLLRKPFRMEELLKKVRDAIDGPPAFRSQYGHTGTSGNNILGMVSRWSAQARLSWGAKIPWRQG